MVAHDGMLACRMPPQHCLCTESPGRSRGFRSAAKRLGSILLESVLLESVLGNNRSTEPVVDAGGEEVDVLLDTVGLQEGESNGLPVHEQVVVLEADRPVRCEAIFNTGTH